ncbi:hypothetical protein HGM15179_008388 [Zosterops borbonicus]|uniref:Uncharacterized protein n=1 Tax=Zosterops borbonicus TaxID=364589 RepID=A0A8K1GH24_9PASS|nr:hypothetical protein HGM15179_008388 [Zosterops borbonicus]
MPVSSKTDPPGKAEHHQQWWLHLWDNRFNKGEMDPEQEKLQPERGVRGAALQTPSSVRKEEKQVLQALDQRFTTAPGADHGEAAVPLQPREVPGETGPPAAPGGPHSRADGHLQEAVTPPGPVLEHSWQDLWREEPTLQQVCWQDL